MRKSGLATLILALLACESTPPPGAVRAGDAVVTQGSVDSTYLANKLNQISGALEACYARALIRDHQAEGTIELELEGRGYLILPNVTANTTEDDTLATCVRDAIAGIALSDTEPGMPWEFTAEWPIEFSIAQQ